MIEVTALEIILSIYAIVVTLYAYHCATEERNSTALLMFVVENENVYAQMRDNWKEARKVIVKN